MEEAVTDQIIKTTLPQMNEYIAEDGTGGFIHQNDPNMHI